MKDKVSTKIVNKKVTNSDEVLFALCASGSVVVLAVMMMMT